MAADVDALLKALAASEYAHLLNEHEPVPTAKGVRVGPVELLPGINEKPVIRDAASFRMMRGSGRLPRAETEAAAADTQFHESQTHRDAMLALTPLFGKDMQSLEHLLDLMWEGFRGHEVESKCRHAGCVENHLVYLKPDIATAFKYLENLVGKAAQTQNVNLKEESTVNFLEHRVVEITVQGLMEPAAASRRELIESYGYTVQE